MRLAGRKHQFVTPQKSMMGRVSEAISNAADNVLSKISDREKSPRKLKKEIETGLIFSKKHGVTQ